jgi:hypothetical protein
MEGFNVVGHTAMRQINLEARQSRRDVSWCNGAHASGSWKVLVTLTPINL